MRRYLLSVSLLLCYASAISQTYSHIIKLNNGNLVCGGYIATDSSANDFVITCVSKQGEVIWKHVLGGSKDDGGAFSGNREYMSKTSDGGVFFAGATASSDGDIPGVQDGGFDIFVARFDAKGNILWKYTYGGDKTEYLSSVVATPDSGCVFSATTLSDNNGDVPANHSVDSTDIWIVKLNADGNIEWSKTYGGSGNEVARSIKIAGDNYIFTGDVGSTDGDLAGSLTTGVWVVEIDSTGVITWKERMVLK